MKGASEALWEFQGGKLVISHQNDGCQQGSIMVLCHIFFSAALRVVVHVDHWFLRDEA